MIIIVLLVKVSGHFKDNEIVDPIAPAGAVALAVAVAPTGEVAAAPVAAVADASNIPTESGGEDAVGNTIAQATTKIGSPCNLNCGSNFGNCVFVCTCNWEGSAICQECINLLSFTRRDPALEKGLMASRVNDLRVVECPYCRGKRTHYYRLGENKTLIPFVQPYGWLGGRPFQFRHDFDKYTAMFTCLVFPIYQQIAHLQFTIDNHSGQLTGIRNSVDALEKAEEKTRQCLPLLRQRLDNADPDPDDIGDYYDSPTFLKKEIFDYEAEGTILRNKILALMDKDEKIQEAVKDLEEKKKKMQDESIPAWAKDATMSTVMPDVTAHLKRRVVYDLMSSSDSSDEEGEDDTQDSDYEQMST